MRMVRNRIVVLGVALVAASCEGCRRSDVPPLDAEAEAQVAETGAEVAAAMRTRLAQRLMAAIQEGGPEAAIDVCAVEALPLTDSIATATGVTLKRTSTRVRNPRNAPDSLEAEALDWFERQTVDGQPPERFIQSAGAEGWRYYEPLRVVALCVNCHGPEDRLSPAVRQALAGRYPGDRATGYVEGDIRGLIRVGVPAGAVRR